MLSHRGHLLSHECWSAALATNWALCVARDGGIAQGDSSRFGLSRYLDFPLAPEEETPDFQHLAMGLQLRFMRAVEHWRGNTDLTLTAIIMRAVEQGVATGSFGPQT